MPTGPEGTDTIVARGCSTTGSGAGGGAWVTVTVGGGACTVSVTGSGSGFGSSFFVFVTSRVISAPSSTVTVFSKVPS